MDAAFDYYTSELAAGYKDPVKIQAKIESIKADQLHLTVDEVQIERIEFYKLNGETAATASCRYYYTVRHATDEYLEANLVEKNTQYVRDIFVEYIVEGEDWKATKITRGAAEKVN